jgi:hypothetical protein
MCPQVSVLIRGLIVSIGLWGESVLTRIRMFSCGYEMVNSEYRTLRRIWVSIGDLSCLISTVWSKASIGLWGRIWTILSTHFSLHSRHNWQPSIGLWGRIWYSTLYGFLSCFYCVPYSKYRALRENLSTNISVFVWISCLLSKESIGLWGRIWLLRC